MKISTLFYVLGQGIKSTFKNKWFSLASIATISACLFLFGLCYAVVMNFQYMVKTQIVKKSSVGTKKSHKMC